ncbi:hypothetical protein J3R83DRAFT_3960 [Lanmaoa asiatica]|nr:hypothetical protein J3R83DRAFT_3960 [Lanmaoa asiatica]
MASKYDHNKVDPQGPTKTDIPAPVFFPALLHRRVSHSNHIYLPLLPCYPFYLPSHPLSSLYHMAGPHRSAPAAGSSRDRAYKVQPPRPPNAWILYRSFKFAMIKQTSERLSQANVSKRISDMWKNEAEDVKRHFERMAEDKKAEHQQLYPDYRFAPQKREEKTRKGDRKMKSKKSKAREATPVDAVLDAVPTMPAPPLMPYMPQPYFVPGYHPNMVLPHPYSMHYLPEARYGPGGPSPPISAAPSPAPYGSSESPEARSYPEETVASSSSSPSAQPSSTSESRASSSSQLPANPLYISSLPSSHQPSPNAYATQTLPPLPFQTPAELPLTSPQAQPPSPENTVVPAAPVWNNIPAQLSSLDFQNSEVVNFDIPISQTQNFTEFQQSLSSSSPFESLQGMLSRTDENGVFNLSNIDSSDLLAHPQGHLEVTMGPQASTIDYNEELFADFDFAEFQQHMASFTDNGLSSAPVAPPSIEEDLQALFHVPNNPEVQAYTTAQQRQPSISTQDMMDFFNFDAAEGSTEDTSTVSPPVPTTVAPQQVRLQNTQHAAAMPIFTQMTNTPTVTSGTEYVPPAGAIYSSTRRVAGSWKPSFTIPLSQMEEPVQSWTLSSN